MNGDRLFDAKALGHLPVTAQPAKKPRKQPKPKAPKSTELKALICERFRAAAMAFEPNQRALSEHLDINPKQLNGYIKGKNYPDELVLVKFCVASGCTMDWLFLGQITHADLPAGMAALIGLNFPHLLPIDFRSGSVRSDQAQAGEQEEQAP